MIPQKQVMAAMRADAHLVLDRRELKTTGPHIHPAPVYYRRGAEGGWIETVADTRQPEAGAGAGPTIVTPANPSDYGAVIDASGSPLFGVAGTTADQDVNQNQADNCYLLATWDSLLRQNPQYAQAICTRLPSGLNAMTFRRSLASPVTVQTSSQISSGEWARPNPVTGAIDGCIVEKTYAYFRTGANTIASTNYGFPGAVMTDLGVPNVALLPKAAGVATAVMATLAAGNACAATSFAVIPAGIPIVASHCYSVIKCWVDAAGNIWVTLRNPWGIDGQGAPLNPPNSEITLPWAQVCAAFSSISCGTGYAANVIPTPTPTPAPTPTPTPPPPPPPPAKPVINFFAGIPSPAKRGSPVTFTLHVATAAPCTVAVTANGVSVGSLALTPVNGIASGVFSYTPTVFSTLLSATAGNAGGTSAAKGFELVAQ